MRITSLKVENIPPIRHLEINDMGSVVIIAGANGSGKTRLKEAIINTFRSPKSPQVGLRISSTRPEEQSTWGEETLIIEPGAQNPKLTAYMTSRTRGGTYVGSVIQVDSDRSVKSVSFGPITYTTPDPDDADINYTYYLNPFVNRWNDIVNKIYQKAASRDRKIAQFVKDNPDKIGSDALSKHPDSFLPYQEVFSSLLLGKKLEAIDPTQPKEFQYRVGDSQPLQFISLGSGEQEVVKVAFDLIWKKIRHCIILVDEPELHLHPTLAFRLIETLKGLGDGTNQFIFFTHSADLISTYYSSNSVYFIDPEEIEQNQARMLSILDNRHTATVSRVAANLGLFAVGKKIVFIEGANASVDRLTYHKISQVRFPEAYLLPVGSVENISALGNVVDELANAIFGIGLFMVRDRDGLLPEQVQSLEKNPRMRCLKRRHIENYFLDAYLIGKVAEYLYLRPEATRVDAIEEALLKTAHECLKTAVLLTFKELVRIMGFLRVPSIRGVESKDWPEIEKEMDEQLTSSHLELGKTCSKEALLRLFTKEKEELECSLPGGSWKTVFPGKIVFAKFCGDFLKQYPNRVRQVYLDFALREKQDAIQDIIEIFDHFKALGA